MKKLWRKLSNLVYQFLDNPFTMFQRSGPDVDHNTMTGVIPRQPQFIDRDDGSVIWYGPCDAYEAIPGAEHSGICLECGSHWSEHE